MEAEAELGNLAGVRHVLLVLSGKGGVGKSTLSAELALALRHEGKKVGILDVDLCGPSIPRMLRAQGRAVHQCDSGWAPVFVDREQSIALMSVGFLLEKPNEAVVWRGPKKSGSGRVRGSQCGREDPRQRPASSVSAGGWEAAAGPGRTPQHGGSPRSPDQAVRVGRGLGTVGLPGRGHAPRDLGRAHGRRGSPAPPQAPAGPPGHHPAGGVRGGRAAGADLLQEGGVAGAGGRGEHERLHVPALLGVHQHLLQGWRRGARQTRGGPLPRLCASGPRAHQEPGGGPRLHPGVLQEPCVPRADRHSPEGSGRGCRSALLTRAATATPGASERAVRSSGPGTCGPPCRGQSRSQRPSLSACDRPAWGLVPRPLAPLRAHLLSRSGKGGHLVTSEDPAPLNASRCTVSSLASRLASASPPQRALHLVWGDPGELPGDTALGPFAHLGQGRGRHRVVPM